MAYELEIETKPKFFNLNIFWIKLADFMDIVPRHPHLDGIKFRTRAMAMADMFPAKPLTPRSATGGSDKSGSPLVNGLLTNGEGRKD